MTTEHNNERIARLEAQRNGDKELFESSVQSIQLQITDLKTGTDTRFDELKKIVIEQSLAGLITKFPRLAYPMIGLLFLRILGVNINANDVVQLFVSTAKALWVQ